MASAAFTTLRSRLSQIESHLLPAVNPTGTYSIQEEDLTRSYCLLCHAEIEAYIEGIIRETTKKAVDKWKLNKTQVHPIIFHLAYSYKQDSGKSKEPPYGMVIHSYNALNKALDKNNGIKEDNINQLLKPIGFEIDTTLASTLSSFGQTRGDIAHQSFQTQRPLDPVTQKSNIANIIIGLKDFDVDIVNYESTGILNTTPRNMKWNPVKITMIFDKIKKIIRR